MVSSFVKMIKRVVSSAYIINPKTSVMLGKSFIYIENNRGPRIKIPVVFQILQLMGVTECNTISELNMNIM